MGLELLSLDQRQIWPTGLSFTSEKQTLNSKVNTTASMVATTMQLNVCFSDSGEERRNELMSSSVTPPSAWRLLLGKPSRQQLPACSSSAVAFLTFPAARFSWRIPAALQPHAPFLASSPTDRGLMPSSQQHKDCIPITHPRMSPAALSTYSDFLGLACNPEHCTESQ